MYILTNLMLLLKIFFNIFLNCSSYQSVFDTNLYIIRGLVTSLSWYNDLDDKIIWIKSKKVCYIEQCGLETEGSVSDRKARIGSYLLITERIFIYWASTRLPGIRLFYATRHTCMRSSV